jgi:hypothetical protein
MFQTHNLKLSVAAKIDFDDYCKKLQPDTSYIRNLNKKSSVLLPSSHSLDEFDVRGTW